MKQKRITKTDLDNINTERFLYKRFKLLALTKFKWGGLYQLGVEERHVEGWEFSEGLCVVFEDKDYGLMCLRGDGQNNNILDDPTEYRVWGNGYSKVVKAEDCVVIENNKLRMPTADVIDYFVEQLYNTVRTRDVNVETLKLPFILATSDKELLTGKKIKQSIQNNEPYITINKEVINIEELVTVLQTGVKPFTNELTDLYHDILNEALTYLGINNANTDKKERLITDEANANNQFIESCSELFLEARERACEEINKMFGTSISVELRNKGEEYALEYAEEYTSREQQPDDTGA